jgi:hypothetical protein
MTPLDRSSRRRDRATDDPKYRAAVVTLLGVLPALKVLDNYREYVEQQLRRDEALVKALRACAERDTISALPAGVAASVAEDPRQADTILDEVAKREGWRP